MSREIFSLLTTGLFLGRLGWWIPRLWFAVGMAVLVTIGLLSYFSPQ